MCWNVAGDDGTGCHSRIGTNPYPGEDHAAGPKAGTFFYSCSDKPLLCLAIALSNRRQFHSRASRTNVVRKTYRRADKNIILDLDPFPNRSLVLDSDPVTDARAGLEERVVADIAIMPNHGPLHNVRKRPYPRALTNLLAFAERLGMDKNAGGVHHGYVGPSVTRTRALLRAMLSAAASIIRTTRQPLTPSARGFIPERMHSKKSSTSASSGSLD